MSEMKPNPNQMVMSSGRATSEWKDIAAEDNPSKEWKSMLLHQDLMNTLISNLYHKISIGEMSMELTGFHGEEINISQLTVVAVGLMDQPAQWLTESTSKETELGLI